MVEPPCIERPAVLTKLMHHVRTSGELVPADKPRLGGCGSQR